MAGIASRMQRTFASEWAHRVMLMLAAAIFIVGGALHFVWPTRYARIVPAYLPWPRGLVFVSGVAEIVGGACLLIPLLRRLAGWGLIALLIAVFPANVYMALEPERFADLGVPTWALWARLPLQALAIAWVWWVSRFSETSSRSPARS